VDCSNIPSEPAYAKWMKSEGVSGSKYQTYWQGVRSKTSKLSCGSLCAKEQNKLGVLSGRSINNNITHPIQYEIVIFWVAQLSPGGRR
jgi:hypothetical protein